MKFFRDERVGASFMLLAACLGFALQNAGALDEDFASTRHEMWPWISQIGMALFFALIGFELRNEFATGLFRNPRAILVPALGALVGVFVPAAVYLVIASTTGATAEIVSAWPMVTATDVSFALMVFSLLAKGLPVALRTFLLSFAVIDDIFATLALAIGFMRPDALTPLLSTATAMVLAFSLRPKQVKQVIRFLSPLVAFVVLPVFAFFAMQVNFNSNAIFVGSASILLVLISSRAVTKWLGVYLGAIAGNRLLKRQDRLDLSRSDFLRISSLAGIGFTVSLLAADLAFGAESPMFAASASVTVLASLSAAGLAAIALRARRASK